jgi:polyhydroxyalkanoate synthase
MIKGGLVLGGRPVDPKLVTCSVLHAMAQYDHIAPYDSTRPLTSILGSTDKQDLTVKGGHVSLISGQNALLRLWPTVNEWLSVRSV